jgi:hypothetical protein
MKRETGERTITITIMITITITITIRNLKVVEGAAWARY